MGMVNYMLLRCCWCSRLNPWTTLWDHILYQAGGDWTKTSPYPFWPQQPNFWPNQWLSTHTKTTLWDAKCHPEIKPQTQVCFSFCSTFLSASSSKTFPKDYNCYYMLYRLSFLYLWWWLSVLVSRATMLEK